MNKLKMGKTFIIVLSLLFFSSGCTTIQSLFHTSSHGHKSSLTSKKAKKKNSRKLSKRKKRKKHIYANEKPGDYSLFDMSGPEDIDQKILERGERLRISQSLE